MTKILIFGNSGSGKSTLAKRFAGEKNLAHLDLDTLAWLPVIPPERAPISESKEKIDQFIALHNNWVVEGGYADLLELLASDASEIIFLNPGVDQCIENAINRPWEPHKYPSKAAQDDNLNMLLNWIVQYTERDDVFSYRSHMRFYEAFIGKKHMYTSNN